VFLNKRNYYWVAMSLNPSPPNDTFAQNSAILTALAFSAEAENSSGLKVNSKEKFKVIFNGHEYKLLPAKKNNAFIRFFRFIFGKSPPRTSDNLCQLKNFFESIVNDVTQDPTLKDRYNPLVAQAFEGLKQLFEVYRTDNSKESILKCNDILEALSVAYRKDNSLNQHLGLNVQRIAAPPIATTVKPSLKDNSIPLVRFSDMTQAIGLIEAVTAGKTAATLTLKEVHQQLQGVLFDERVPMGRVIAAMYSHELHIHTLDKLLTWAMGKKNRYKYVTALSIVKFLKSLNVTPYVELNGQLYAYNEVYKTELRKESSNDNAFLRCFKDEIVQEFLLKNACDQQEEIYKTCGEGNLVISNSFNRLRLHYIGKNDGIIDPDHPKGVNAKFNITGKVMSESKKNQKAVKHEKSYNGKFAFSVKNMLGSEDDRNTAIAEVVPASQLKIEKAHRKLLDCMTNMIDRHDMTMIVQRLAPEDVHHFAFPVKGTLLTKEESCRALLEMLEKTAHEHEQAQLRELVQYFANQSDADKADAPINIQGTQCSVNSKALHKHSEILAQNDRRITMMRHEDGSLSIHTYIGATGVNAVNVYGVSGAANTVGTKVGSMGFGNLSGKKAWQPGQAYDNGPSLVSRLRTRMTSIYYAAGKKGKLGAPIGAFPKEGSTVVSLYFSKDMVPTEELHKFTKTVRYKVTRNLVWVAVRNCFCAIIGKHFGMKKMLQTKISRAIEVKAALGDVIGLPKIYVAVKAVIETISRQELDECVSKNRNSSHAAVDTIKDAFLKAFDPLKTCASPQDKVANKIWEALKKDPENRTEDERYLLAKLDKGLLHRIG
jgi:hypothetical protein